MSPTGRSPARRPLLAALAGCLLASPPPALAAPPPLVVEAPPSLAGAARAVSQAPPEFFLPAMGLAGMRDGGGPIRVVLAEESSPLAREVPAWVSGYALGAEGKVVLFPARSHAYPYDGLEELLRHEVAHVLFDRAAAGRPVPRWFAEGLAMAASREVTIEDRLRAATVSLVGRTSSLAEVDRLFDGDDADVRRAYALSLSFTRHLLEEGGASLPWRVFRDLREGRSFSASLEEALGSPLPFVEHRFWRRQRSWDRWVVVLSSTAVLWAGITVLALWAARKRRLRDARTRAAWEEAERRAEEERSRAGEASPSEDEPTDEPDRYPPPG